MADVSNSLANWSTTRNSNGPSGTAIAGAGVDDNLREIQGTVRGALAYIGSDITVASTMNLGAVEGSTHNTTGTGTVTSFGTVSAGIRKRLVIGGATTTITHNATSMICPSGASLSLVQGDVVEAESLGGGNWRITGVTRANGKSVTPSLASEITNSASGRMTATAVNTALSQLESLAAPTFAWLTVAGTDTLTATASTLVTAYLTGDIFRFVAVATNTGAVTLNISGLGTRSVTKHGTTALVAGDIVSGSAYDVRYDGTRFQLLNPSVPNFQGGVSIAGAATITGALTVGSITSNGSVVIPNAQGYQAKDSGGTTRGLIGLTGSDAAIIDGGVGGVGIRVSNAATSALVISGSGKVSSGTLVASTSEVASGAGNVFTTPAHGGIKAWCKFSGASSGTFSPTSGFNVFSITKSSSGIFTITLSNAVSINAIVMVNATNADGTNANSPATTGWMLSTIGVGVITWNSTTGVGIDFPEIHVAVIA